MVATRLLRNKWVLLLGVLAVVGLMAGQSLADGPHHGGYGSSYRSGGGYHHGSSWGNWGGYSSYRSPSYSYYRPVVVRPPCVPYYDGYSTYGCTSGVRVVIVVR